jgi:hypothetical protein
MKWNSRAFGAAAFIAAANWLSPGISPAAENVQLYLTPDTVPKKGYVDSSQAGTDEKVAFRECESQPKDPVVWLDPKSLKPITGTCDTLWALWGGTVTDISKSGIKVRTAGNVDLNITSTGWTEAFGNDRTKWAKVGDTVGGYDFENPTELFRIECTKETVDTCIEK